jgi:hypothetical protein
MKTRAPFGLDASRGVALAGVAAAVVLTLVVNVLVARHYRRWDWTKSQRYSLTGATVTTLHELPGPVDLWVLMGSADPLGQSVKQLLVSYQGETSKLNVHYVDPDRDTLALEDVRKKFKIDTGRTEDGHVVTDAIMVVAREDRHWFLGPEDMVEISSAEDGRAKPREEQAITSAIRNVMGGEKATLCFTAGHGELLLADGGPEGLGTLNDVLTKDNYETRTVDTTEPDAHDPFKGCSVVVVAGARAPFAKEEEARLRTYLLEGGNLLACLSPINAGDETGAASENGMAPAGLDDALAPFGIALDEDLVFELDAKLQIPGTRGIRFIATPKAHPVTAALVRGDEGTREPPRVMLNFARSMHHAQTDGASPAVDLLTSSAESFGVRSIAGAAMWTDTPERKPTDVAGPLALAMASERPKTAPSAPHGPRVVVIGSGSAITEQAFREPLPLRGTALMVESAISWLAARPAILDVPAKASVAAGIRITDESRSDVRRYVLVFMPLAAALLGLGVWALRRSTEGTARAQADAADEETRKKNDARGPARRK